MRWAPLLLAACAGAPDGPDRTPVTWHDDVAPLLADHCVSCHTAGGVAPFDLTSFDEAATVADLLAAAAADRTMPPYLVDNTGDCGTWRSDDAWLTDDEIAVLDAWVADGLREGEPAPAPTPTAPPRLEDPDLTLDIGVDYAPAGDPAAPDDYRCFIVDPALDEDVFLTAYAIEPGNDALVHHVILYTLDAPEAEAQASELEQADGAPGYSCFGSAVVAPSRPIAAWAPGTGFTAFPDDSGLRLLAGRKLVMQVHYYTGDATGTDRTRLHLKVAPSVPREAFIYLLGDLSMVLEPGLPSAASVFEIDLQALGLPLGVFVRGVFPHMHLRGRTLRLEVAPADERAPSCMADVPRWDFDWQQLYWLERPAYVYPTDTLRLSCTFDTTGDHQQVRWGDGTDDEMCLIGLFVTLG